MLASIAYYQILGFSVIALIGITTYLLLITSAIIGHRFLKGKMKKGLKVHIILSSSTILIATFHAILVIGAKL
ncbi:hypothetical protein ACFL10_01670 [Patescibacteria group bacterium]